MRKSTFVARFTKWSPNVLLALSWFSAGAAGATTSEFAVSATTGAYSQTDQFSGALQLSSNVQSLLLNDTTPGHISQLGVTVSATTGLNGSFTFDQNLYRLGTGSANLTTQVMDTITNSSDASVFLRFDSQITPGHIAARGRDDSNVVFFQFKVEQISGALDTVLYTANGSVGPGGDPIINTSDGVAFNGLQSYSSGDDRSLDWSATNLDLALQPIQASSSSIILYTTTTYITGGVACSDLSSCQGTQVAFGDPRDDGGVANARQQAALAGPLDPAPTVPLIGRLYDPYTTYTQVVPMDAPLPPTPPVLPPVTYAPPPPVPEPSAWAMLIAGVALVGALMRRRRAGPISL